MGVVEMFGWFIVIVLNWTSMMAIVPFKKVTLVHSDVVVDSPQTLLL